MRRHRLWPPIPSKKPLFHFYPGSQAHWAAGLQLPPQRLQNWEISCVNNPLKGGQILPLEAVRLAKEYGCRGIAWTYNEPTVWFEYTLDSAKLARESGLYTAYVSNGFMTTEALDAIGPYLDAYRIDVKGFTAEAYTELANIKEWKGILDNAKEPERNGICMSKW